MTSSPSPETHDGPMASPPWPWTRWAIYAGVLVCIGLVSVFFAVGVSDPERNVRVFWPERLSASTPGALVMTVTTKTSPPRPSANAEVTLYQLAPAWGESVAEAVAEGTPRMRKISTATTDTAGLARLDLPPVAFIPAGPQDQGATAALREGHFIVTAPTTPDPLKPNATPRVPESIHVLVKVVHDGDVLYAHRSFSIPDRANLALTTDRPLYQPGQRIQARALAADLDSGRPAKGDVRWELRDPRSNLIARETTPTSDAGVASWVVPLADRCVQGNYTLTASFDGRTINRTLEVRPFRLPRYKVTVTPKALKAEPGKPLTVEIEGRYTYGDPVAGADVGVVVRAMRQGAFPSSATYSVKLDKDGKTSVVWEAPKDLSPGSAITLEARVTSETGRVERGKATLRASGRALTVDLLSAQGDRWSQRVANTGHLIALDPDGSPAEGVVIKLALPEKKAEREVTVTTDAKGHAQFTWTPPNSGAFVLDATITPSANSGMRPMRRKFRVSVDSSVAMIETSIPFAQVGEPYPLVLHNMKTAAALVATHRRYTVAAASAPASPGQPAAANFVFGPEARGLTAIYLYDAHGSLLAQTRVWVRQEGTERVTVRADADRYRPGTLATIDLDFPPTPPGAEGIKPPAQPVTYGLVGVDEALYALKERTDAPLPVLMRQDPGDVAPLLGALGALDGADSDDPVARKLSAMRFVRALSGTFNTPYLHNDGSTTRSVRRIQRRPWVNGWVTLLGLILLGITAFSGWATWHGFTRRAWSFKRAAKLVGVGFVAMGAAVVLSAIDPPGSLAGGALVWAGVVAAWLIATAVRRRDLPLGRWLLATLTLLLICGALAGSLAETRPNSWTEIVVAVAFGLPALVWTVSIALWALTLHHHALRKPAFGLASWMAIVAAGFLATVSLSQGSMEQAMPTSASAPDRFAKMVVEKEARSDDALLFDDDAPADNKPSPSKSRGGPRVRSYFPETMVWMPELRSDAKGHAQAKLEVPDSITTWRLNVSASTWDGRFGEAQAGLLVIQPFFVELDLPTHLTVGDAIETPVTLVNSSDRPLQVTLSAQGADGLASRAVFDAPIPVPAKQRVTVSAPIVATAPGEGALTITAITDVPELQDAVKRVATVRPDGRELARSASGIVGEGWRGAVAFPQDALPGTLALDVSVAPGVIADALSGLDSMLRQPNGCFEQTSSANFPNVMILRTLRAASPDDFEGGREAWTEAHTSAQRMVSLGYQRMLTFQHSSGGFSLYPDRAPDIMLTAYGLMQLAQMRDVYPVDLNVIRRAAQWLVAQQNKGGSWPVYAKRAAGSNASGAVGDAAQLRSTAFVAWALAQTPEPKPWEPAIKRALTHASSKLDRADAPDTLALLANAFAAAGRADDAKRALDRLAPQAKRSGDQVFWPATSPTWLWARGPAADIEVTALTAHAMLVTETQADLLQPALRYLVTSRAPRGGWWSTQATAWALRTLERLRALSTDKPADLTLTAAAAPIPHAGDPTLPPGKVTVHPNDTQLTAFATTPASTGAVPVEVATTTKTSAMVQATARYAVPWTSPAAKLADPRLSVALKPDTRSAKRGALVEVVANVRNLTQDRHGATIVELPLPPGAALRRADLEDLETTRRIDRFEVLPTHARLYISGLAPDADLTFVYRFAPMLPGTVSLPPARAYPFYAPNPVAESDGGDMTVAP